MKKTIIIVYICATLNFCGNSLIVGGIWWGWKNLLLNNLGLILWGLFLNSTILAFGLFMIAIAKITTKIMRKKEKLSRNYEKKQSYSDTLARSFKEESWRRNIDKLDRLEMRELMIHFIFIIEQLSEHIEILLGRKPNYIEFIEKTIKALLVAKDNNN